MIFTILLHKHFYAYPPQWVMLQDKGVKGGIREVGSWLV